VELQRGVAPVEAIDVRSFDQPSRRRREGASARNLLCYGGERSRPDSKRAVPSGTALDEADSQLWEYQDIGACALTVRLYAVFDASFSRWFPVLGAGLIARLDHSMLDCIGFATGRPIPTLPFGNLDSDQTARMKNRTSLIVRQHGSRFGGAEERSCNSAAGQLASNVV
jgi:hypothetical protein